ncbi:MAG: glycosyltransferase family 2 protein [Candidatus Omnitrophica bacterium]|nr:glycosyltransferase family 2 protein [Candidatus Omnitrophota bacterium]
MKNSPLVSIVVVNFNGRKYLKGCFDSLYAGTYANIEIILVDNGSCDGSVSFVRDNYKRVNIVDLGRNLGLAVASNKGADLAKGKYLFFYNNDTLSGSDLIASLVNVLESDSRIGIAGCRTYTYNGERLINAGVPCDLFGYPYGKTAPFYVDAAIFISRRLFDLIGRFDEKMFLYGEDRDLCWRCWLYGYEVVVADNAKFFHDSACITQDLKEYQTNIRKRFLGEFNALRSVLKNYSLGFLIFILPVYMLISLAEIIAFLARGDTSVIKNAYLRSYSENLRDFKSLFVLRKMVQSQRKISDFALIRHMDIISGKLRLLFAIGLPRFGDKNKYVSSSAV